ncbi:hypothetical protein GCM10008018_14010 [Paenibacillus marchantiophytorum]|uniref:DUF1501 domain-containing protein n=1 Tax=Paenibacillus marchantiophytorum TaxID=1619310 RepID=A0ABQ2BU16_9BACL|nr:DUF1501 domain-containing protein [Paenibacillus marchantiophytorum]GGI45815.1 hypothetical protein GCM10008018_14010 [Paenibacillus marchantiophytorum]
MKLSRRDFLLKGTAMFATLGLGEVLLPTGGSLFAQEPADGETVLVVVQLGGGNDGINTLIPYGQGAYYDARPTLAYQQSEVLALNNQVGLHPSLKNLKRLYDANKLAVIQGVGYPNPNLSHFRSMEIWQTAEPAKVISSGWLARYVESSLRGNVNPLRAVQIGGNDLAFHSDNLSFPVLGSLESFQIFSSDTPVLDKNRLNQAYLGMYGVQNHMEALRITCQRGQETLNTVEAVQAMNGGYVNSVQYPYRGIAGGLQTIAKLIAGKSGTRVFNIVTGGFDDHLDERVQHAELLADLDQALGAFYDDLVVQGAAHRVAVMVFSEFGRRVKENGSAGTDHGAAAPMFVLGGKVKGGLYGAYPSLTDLSYGDLKYQVDFRSVYSTILESWLKGDTQSVLGKTYENLNIF